MQTLVYRMSLSKNRARLWFGRAYIVLAILLLAVLGFRLLYALRAGGPGMFDGLELAFYVLVLAAMLCMILGNVHAVRPNSNFMTLDESALTYVRFGIRQRWAWPDLPEFGITVHPYGARVVEFRPPPAGGWRSRLGFWVVWTAGGWFARGGRIIRISDEYETPLQEIVANLNEYRERALGGHVTGGSQAPKPA